jgi:hypothetical protein
MGRPADSPNERGIQIATPQLATPAFPLSFYGTIIKQNPRMYSLKQWSPNFLFGTTIEIQKKIFRVP